MSFWLTTGGEFSLVGYIVELYVGFLSRIMTFELLRIPPAQKQPGFLLAGVQSRVWAPPAQCSLRCTKMGSTGQRMRADAQLQMEACVRASCGFSWDMSSGHFEGGNAKHLDIRRYRGMVVRAPVTETLCGSLFSHRATQNQGWVKNTWRYAACAAHARVCGRPRVHE